MGTHYRGTAKEMRALDAFIKLMRAARTMQGHVERRLLAHDLTENQFGVLEILMHLGPLTPSELSRKQFTSCGNVTLLLDNLERNGLVRRERSPDDRRSVLVHLTRAGRERAAQALAIEVEQLTREFGILTAEEQAMLGLLCRKLGLGVAEMPEGESPTPAGARKRSATSRASSARRGARVRR